MLKPDRAIKSSGKIASATRHAEEDVANEFVEAVEKQVYQTKKLRESYTCINQIQVEYVLLV